MADRACLCSGVTPGADRALGGREVLSHPDRKEEQAGNVFSQLPNILSTDYWLRKAKTEEAKGDVQVPIMT